MTTVVSIQSAVAYGHAGNSSAVFPLQRSGVDVWPVYTVNFSNHTGYGSWRGKAIPAEEVWDIVLGIDERGAGRKNLTAYLSKDDGENWLGGLLLDERGSGNDIRLVTVVERGRRRHQLLEQPRMTRQMLEAEDRILLRREGRNAGRSEGCLHGLHGGHVLAEDDDLVAL